MKKLTNLAYEVRPWGKILLKMKLTIALFLFGLVTVSASTYSQNTKMDISFRSNNIFELFKEIEQKSEFYFFYQKKELKDINEITVDLKDATVMEILDEVLEGSGVTYKVVDRYIIIREKGQNMSIDEVVQQQKTIAGTVTDESGLALSGVTVILKGTTNGTITDSNGKYSLSIVPENAILQFSFVGMKTQEIVVGNKTTINVVLVEDAIGIEEVVAIGYGTQKKATLTGSISNLKGEDVKMSPAPNVSSSLAGRLPGLTVNQRSGEPGRDDPTILIRGNGTFGNNTPLVVIDGVQRDGMSRLNPDDIESLTVLKDASAAIYGARAANGVILITTKKGTLGKPVFDFSYNTSFNRPTKVLEVLDGPTYARAFNEGSWYRAGRPATSVPIYSEEYIQITADGTDPILHPNTNWADEVLKPYAMQNRTSASVRGGTDKIKYFVSFGSLGEDGNFKYNPTKYNQYNLRSNLELSLNDNLKIGLNLSGRKEEGSYPSSGTWTNFFNILHANPLLVAKYPNGLIGGGRLGQSPLLRDQVGPESFENTPIYTSFTAEYIVPFIKGLKISGSYNYDIRNEFTKTFSIPYYYYEYNVLTTEYDKKIGSNSMVTLTDRYDKWSTKLFNFQINYTKNFDDHSVGVMLGSEQQTNKYNWASAYRQNFVSSAIDQLDVGSTAAVDKNSSGSASNSGYNNYFGRLNYNYKEKYLVELLFRFDGSQNFPNETRYGFFPGVSAGWRLSEENFMKNNLEFVNNLKLRGSYGEIGNDRVAQYQYLQAFSFSDNYVFGGKDVSGISANTMPNPNITWEVSKKTDLGLEAELWQGLLGVDLTLFKENRSNILAKKNVSVSNVFGFSGLPDENIGKVENKGYEFILSHRHKFGEFKYQVSGNVAFARNKIVFMDEVPNAAEYYMQTGRPVGAALFYQADGIVNTPEELAEYKLMLSTAQLGDTKLKDMNDDKKIDANDQVRSYLTSTPEYVFGISLSAQYKKFDLSMLLQGQTNVENYDDQFSTLGTSDFSNAPVERATDRWTVDNPNGTMPRADDQGGNRKNNTMWVFDASFIRVKTVEIGYTLPGSLVSKAGLSDVRFYVSGFNLLTFTKHDWIDPEVNGGYLYYPQQKTLNIGVNVKF